MPFKDFNFKSAFDESYELGAEGLFGHPNTRPEVRLHYHRHVMLPIAKQRASGLVENLGWTSATRIAVVGAGFGWLVESLKNDHGISNVVALDTSTYIQDNQNVSEEADYQAAVSAVGLDPASGEGLSLVSFFLEAGPRATVSILNEDMLTSASRERVASALGGSIDVVLTENLLENFFDSEVAVIDFALKQTIGAEIVHFVTPAMLDIQGNLIGQVSGEFNWKTLPSWASASPSALFIQVGDFSAITLSGSFSSVSGLITIKKKGR